METFVPDERAHALPANPALLPRVMDDLLAARTVLLFGEIDAELAHGVCAQVLALAERSTAPIRVVVNSPGGHIEAGDTIHDVLRFVAAPIVMVGTGWVASAAALVYVAADRERRFALPNTRFMLHQPLGGVSGPSSDVEIEAAQILSVRQRLVRIFAGATGQPIEKVMRETERNHWMTAEQAVSYGLCGRIVEDSSQIDLGTRKS
jgi:ATP-dependent Clp protease protease subunit